MKNLNAVVSTPRQTTLKSLHLKDILAIATLAGQCERQSLLIQAVRRQELTESLEILSEYGFDGDLGILVISRLQLQRGEVTA